MPKRSQGQKRRGRPPSAKPKPKPDDAKGTLFSEGYGVWRMIPEDAPPRMEMARAKLFCSLVGAPALAWTKSHEKVFMNEILPRFVQELESLQAQSLEMPVEDLSQAEVLEADFLSQALLAEVAAATKVGEVEALRLMAAAFTLGQISIVLPRRSKERDFAIGEKFSKNVQAGAAVRKKEPPEKREIEQALQSEMTEHGRRTDAVENTATLFEVGKTTLRKWIKDFEIDF